MGQTVCRTVTVECVCVCGAATAIKEKRFLEKRLKKNANRGPFLEKDLQYLHFSSSSSSKVESGHKA